jgi:hypothetical protein
MSYAAGRPTRGRHHRMRCAPPPAVQQRGRATRGIIGRMLLRQAFGGLQCAGSEDCNGTRFAARDGSSRRAGGRAGDQPRRPQSAWKRSSSATSTSHRSAKGRVPGQFEIEPAVPPT